MYFYNKIIYSDFFVFEKLLSLTSVLVSQNKNKTRCILLLRLHNHMSKFR